MKAYKFHYNGLWLGGTLIIVSSNEETATEIAKKIIDGMGFDSSTLEFLSETELVEGAILHNDTGDY